MDKIRVGQTFDRGPFGRVEVLEIHEGYYFTASKKWDQDNRPVILRHNIEQSAFADGHWGLTPIPNLCERDDDSTGGKVPLNPEEAQLEWERWKGKASARRLLKDYEDKIRKEKEAQRAKEKHQQMDKIMALRNTRTEAINELQSLIKNTSTKNVLTQPRIKELADIVDLCNTLLPNTK